jgi:predicted DsbA family dithiol-disulfide isomerase
VTASAASIRAPFKIEVFADITCPWCYIGKRRLEAALAASPSAGATVEWRAYQRDPAVPEDGTPFLPYLARSVGAANVEAYLAEVSAAGREVGLAFAFDKIAKMPNTLDAHRLIYWAFPAAIKARIVERLFKAHFIDGIDIGDRSALIALATECGMDGEAAFDLFSRRDDIDVLRSEVEISRTVVKQIPFFIFAEDIIVPNGQSEEELKRALAKAIAKNL